MILANDFTHSGKQLWSMLTSRSEHQTVRLTSNLLTRFSQASRKLFKVAMKFLIDNGPQFSRKI
jgi:hypothetical protein